MMNKSELLTAKEVMSLFSITRQTLINWGKKGLLNPIRIGTKTIRYKKSDVELLINKS